MNALPLPKPSKPLSPRQRQVADAVARGLSNGAIAAELHISEHTVKFYLNQLFAHFNVHTRTAVAMRHKDARIDVLDELVDVVKQLRPYMSGPTDLNLKLAALLARVEA